MKDVYKQNYYNMGEVETKECIKSIAVGYDGYSAYLVGQIVKYLSRSAFKENQHKDLTKGFINYVELLNYMEVENYEQVLQSKKHTEETGNL